MERGDGRAWRWTDGAAELTLPHSARRLAVAITWTMRYPVDPRP